MFHPEAVVERAALEVRDRVAVDNVVEKLRSIGIALGDPHSSSVRGASKLRELRPRAGRSRIRVLYGRVGNAFVIACIGPEAKVNPRGFKQATAAAEERLGQIAAQHQRATPTRARGSIGRKTSKR